MEKLKEAQRVYIVDRNVVSRGIESVMAHPPIQGGSYYQVAKDQAILSESLIFRDDVAHTPEEAVQKAVAFRDKLVEEYKEQVSYLENFVFVAPLVID